MELPLAVTSDTEICSVICYFTALGDIGAAIHWKIKEVYAKARMSVQMVWLWQHMFLNSKINVDDEQHLGRPSNAIMEDKMNTIHTLIEQD